MKHIFIYIVANLQNNRIWADFEPNESHEELLNDDKVMVLCAFSSCKVYRPYFFNDPSYFKRLCRPKNALRHKNRSPRKSVLCCRPPVAVPERLSLVHSPCAGLVSAGTADLVIRNIPMIDFVRPVGIMDAFLFIRSGLKRLFFLGYARHFPTSVALAAPGRDRLCLLQDRYRRGNCRFFQRVIVIAFCIRKAHQAKGQGQNHGQQDRDDFFHGKALPFFRYVGFCFSESPL